MAFRELRRPARCQDFAARLVAYRHQSGAALCGRLVGVLRKRDRARSSQAQGDGVRSAIDAEVHLYLAGSDNYSLSARLNVGLPGVGRNVAEQLVKDAEQLCPYSKATRGNIDVAINVV